MTKPSRLSRFSRPGALLLAAFLPAAALAQSEPAPRAILVMDGSGSMWGQIDGVNKIVIARDVVSDLLTDLPAELELGLVAYGHREKGNCADIETIIAPGMGNRSAIRDAVMAINPRGRTPMTQAVVEAARALRHTEAPATVILVSDGIETCDADPCAIAAELEASGIAFTAHVVGFDVAAEPEARTQMQCIADNTGGRFLTADTAQELGAALQEVAAAVTAPTPEPTPAPAAIEQRVVFSALLKRGEITRALEEGVVYEVFRDGAQVMDATQLATVESVLPEGAYVLQAYRLETEEAVRVAFEVTASGQQAVEAVFVEALPPARLEAPASGPAGATLPVTWEGPAGEGDYISTTAPGSGMQAYETFASTADGNPAQLRLPAQPGDYVIRYVMADGPQVLAEIPVTVLPVQEALSAPDSAAIGATVAVAWEGGGHDEDYLAIAPVGAPAADYATYAYVRDGNPLELVMPLEPGTYELRYITGQDTSVFASRQITLTDIPASLDAPASAAAGSTLEVAWQGPGYEGDYLTITTPGDGATGYVSYAYVTAGAPATITVPETPGTYELRYIASGRDSRIMAAQPLVVN
ncbi:MAG: VWA domain-containing protein [Roseovarius sp.]